MTELEQFCKSAVRGFERRLNHPHLSVLAKRRAELASCTAARLGAEAAEIVVADLGKHDPEVKALSASLHYEHDNPVTGTRAKLNPKEKERVCTLHKQGLSINTIAERLSAGETTVRRIVAAEGLMDGADDDE